MTLSECLREVLELLGPNGENWVQGILYTPTPWGKRYCLLGAVDEIGWRYKPRYGVESQPATEMINVLRDATGAKWLAAWNDRQGRTFDHVRAAVERAIALAEEREAAGVRT